MPVLQRPGKITRLPKTRSRTILRGTMEGDLSVEPKPATKQFRIIRNSVSEPCAAKRIKIRAWKAADHVFELDQACA
jgi:hypothetical protein